MLYYSSQQLKKKEQKVKVTISTSRQNISNTTFTKQLPHSAVFCFHSSRTSGWISHHIGGKKSNHLVGSSASGQKSDHLVGNLTTWCNKKKSQN